MVIQLADLENLVGDVVQLVCFFVAEREFLVCLHVVDVRNADDVVLESSLAPLSVFTLVQTAVRGQLFCVLLGQHLHNPQNQIRQVERLTVPVGQDVQLQLVPQADEFG